MWNFQNLIVPKGLYRLQKNSKRLKTAIFDLDAPLWHITNQFRGLLMLLDNFHSFQGSQINPFGSIRTPVSWFTQLCISSFISKTVDFLLQKLCIFEICIKFSIKWAFVDSSTTYTSKVMSFWNLKKNLCESVKFPKPYCPERVIQTPKIFKKTQNCNFWPGCTSMEYN